MWIYSGFIHHTLRLSECKGGPDHGAFMNAVVFKRPSKLELHPSSSMVAFTPTCCLMMNFVSTLPKCLLSRLNILHYLNASVSSSIIPVTFCIQDSQYCSNLDSVCDLAWQYKWSMYTKLNLIKVEENYSSTHHHSSWSFIFWYEVRS